MSVAEARPQKRETNARTRMTEVTIQSRGESTGPVSGSGSGRPGARTPRVEVTRRA